MPSDPTRYSGVDRSVPLFLLTSEPDCGAIDLAPAVFIGQMQIHIFGIGRVFRPRNEIGFFWVVCSMERFRPKA